LLIAQGAHAKEIAERLGHSSPVVTMTVYAHVLPSLDERLTDGLEETFRESSQQLWRVRPTAEHRHGRECRRTPGRAMG
jgi:hypothetical protein